MTFRILVVPTAERAGQILERLQRGEQFVTLARSESIDPSAEQGGLIRHVDVAQLRPELRAALAGLGPGAISPVVQLPTGYAILTLAPEDDVPSSTGAQSPDGVLAAVGSVRYMVSVDGQADALAALDSIRKPDSWNLSPSTMCDVRVQALASGRRAFEQALSRPGSSTAGVVDAIQAHVGLAQLNAYEGKMTESVEQFLAAHRLALSEAPSAALQLEEALGIAYLHKAEMDNGLYRTPGEMCLFPGGLAPPFSRPEDSREAISHFLKYLEQKPEELEVRWLLNLAYRTLGGYPDQVPMQYRIVPELFRSAEDVGRFVDVAAATGVNSFGSAGGLLVDDFENTGRFDVVTSSMNSCGAMRLFHNNGDGTFEDRSSKAGFGSQLGGGLNMLQGDFNNDGCVDILTLRGGWEPAQRRSLLRNNCNSTFTDVTMANGLGAPATSTQTAVWLDFDNDGWLDLFVGNENSPSQLFHNRRDGTFEEVSHRAGVDRVAFTKGVAAGDYDNDGYPDLYVANLSGDNFLYHNNGDGIFTELATAAGVRGGGAGRAFATWFFDYNNDGWPDLFVTSYFISVDETVRTYLGLPRNATTLKLYENRRDGTFRDVTTEVRLDKVFMPMGANFGDIDNDGFLDLYLGTGSPSYGSLVPNVLLRNHNGQYFVDVTASSGTGELHKGHGVAFADLDNDGDQDLIVEIGGATPGDAHALRLFENPGHGNDWIDLKLIGERSNRGAIGARITVIAEDQSHVRRAVHRTVGSGGSFGGSPLQQHVGLGRSEGTVDVDVWWPATRTRQHFTGLAKNQVFEIREFAATPTRLERLAVRLGGAKRGGR